MSLDKKIKVKELFKKLDSLERELDLIKLDSLKLKIRLEESRERFEQQKFV